MNNEDMKKKIDSSVEEIEIEATGDEVLENGQNTESCECGECNEEQEQIAEMEFEEDCEGDIDSSVTQDKTKTPFLKSLSSVVIDQIAIASCALLLLLVFSGVLRMPGLGYEIKTEFYWTFLLIAYIISSILYPVITEATIGNTVGRQLSGLKIKSME